MATYSNQEYADILFYYGKANGNAYLAARLYHERFHPRRKTPDPRVFSNTYRRMAETGNLHQHEPAAGPARHHPEDDENILAAFAADPTTSVRKVAQQLGLSIWKTWSVMNTEKKHPYHYTSVQGLEEGDPVRRIAFCRFLLNADIEDPHYLKSILWTDESKFSREGITNFHNLHYWADKGDNPQMKKQTSFQNKFSVNVWMGVIAGHVIGPHYLPDNLNGDAYLDFLQNDLPPLLENLPINLRHHIIFQNDGCPAHYRLTVRQFLDRTYPDRWIGRSGPILWPARSPDLTPVDYYVWGMMKELVYNEEIQSRVQLVAKIERAALQLRQEIRLRTTTVEIRRRARKCIRNNGSHFEHQK